MPNQVKLSDKTTNELMKEINLKKKELFETRCKLKMNQIENHSLVKKIKKDIARALTAVSLKTKESTGGSK